GLACVLLIALWVRSYWRLDAVDVSNWCEVDSICGEISVMKYDPAVSLGDPWSFYSGPVPPTMNMGDWGTTFGFKRSETPVGPGIVFPLWFPISLVALIAGIPWIRWRFTLRALLIATTLVAAALAL